MLIPCFARQDSPDEMALNQLLSQDVENALWTLTEKERGVLRMRYGLDDGEEKTLEEIGVCFNVRHVVHGGRLVMSSRQLCTALFLDVLIGRVCCTGYARTHQADRRKGPAEAAAA